MLPAAGAVEGVAVGIGVILGVGVGEGFGVAEGVADSVTWVPEARTVKLRINLRGFPVLSVVVTVTVWSPGERPEGGVQVQLPL